MFSVTNYFKLLPTWFLFGSTSSGACAIWSTNIDQHSCGRACCHGIAAAYSTAAYFSPFFSPLLYNSFSQTRKINQTSNKKGCTCQGACASANDHRGFSTEFLLVDIVHFSTFPLRSTVLKRRLVACKLH